MDEVDALDLLAKAGVDVERESSAWRNSLRLLSAFDAIGRDGANALIKIDGERSSSQIYTVLISGGRLGSELFRKDGGDLRSLLREALIFYATNGPGR